MTSLFKSNHCHVFCLALATVLGAIPVVARADVLIATNGERFVGTIIEETTNAVVFESNLGGRMTVYQAQISKLDRPVPEETNAPPAPAVVSTNRPL